MRLKKKFVPQKFYTPPPGISNGPPISVVLRIKEFILCGLNNNFERFLNNTIMLFSNAFGIRKYNFVR